MKTTKNHSNLVDINENLNFKNSVEVAEKSNQEQGGNQSMFYSQCLLSSKGPLGNIWVAGYFFKRLKKRQITDTDISSSVDKILLEGLPSVTYRILAYLLLGVVRIYSKKVEYLYQDCGQTVSDINRFSFGKKSTPLRDIVRPCYSISLPEKFELDSFQLEVEVADDASRDHTSRMEDICLKDGAKDVSKQCSLDHILSFNLCEPFKTMMEHCFEEPSQHWEELNNTQASSAGPVQQKTCSPTLTPEKLASNLETTCLAHTPPDNVLSPSHQMGADMEVSSSTSKKNLETNKEKFRGLRFTQDEGMDMERICGSDVELLNLINNYQADTVEGNESDPQNVPLENHEHVMQEDHEHVMQEDKKVPSPTEKAQDSEVADLAAATTSMVEVVPTPAKKENLQRPSKRKCVFDLNTVLENEVMKHMIKDASALVHKRRKVPHTDIDLWRFHRVPILIKTFTEPLILCPAMELGYIHDKKKTKTQPSVSVEAEPVETTQLETRQVPEKLQVPLTPRTPPDLAIAPETPVRCSISARVFHSARPADSDGEGAHSYENMKNNSFVYEEDAPGPRLMDEMDANEGDSQETHKNKNGWSGRTRTVATYLHEVCQKKHQQGEEVVPLLPIIKRKTKGENARFFFEILVLSSGGFLNVSQQKAYDDVLLQETPKMEATLLNS